ncbi:MAG: metallophosphoesterase, partial [Eubacteriales bacterium]|nr:metallophosphoesterase [Eubacteriales bacterium]
MKKVTSLILCVLMIMSLFTAGLVTVSAADSISYSFTKSEPGFAQGTITLSAADGTYYLYWADNTKALEGMDTLGKVTVSSGKGTLTMPNQTAIPADAEKLIAVKSSSEPTSLANCTVSKASAVYSIPTGKKLSFDSKDALYTFGSISDPQLANDSYGEGRYPYDETHLAAAFETLAKRGVDFTVSSGDTVNDQNGNQTYTAEYKRYQKILADSSYVMPIYEANGNHDATVVWKGSSATNFDAFIKGTGLDSEIPTLQAKKGYYEITEPNTGDHFIFMAMEGAFYTNQNTQFSKAQLDWLEGLLKKYSTDGKNIFIIEHANVAGWGSGDKLTAPYYYDLGLNKDSSDVKRFISLMETYKECVIITGHTHLELSAQYNYSDNNGTSAVMMHNSAIGGVRRLVNGTVDRTAVLGLSEGYIVEVYEDCILFNGINMYKNEVMPLCSYIIPFDTEAIEPIPTEPGTQPVTTPTTVPETVPTTLPDSTETTPTKTEPTAIPTTVPATVP